MTCSGPPAGERRQAPVGARRFFLAPAGSDTATEVPQGTVWQTVRVRASGSGFKVQGTRKAATRPSILSLSATRASYSRDRHARDATGDISVIDVQKVRELIELMVEHGLTEVRIREGETAINLRKGPAGEVVYTTTPAPAAPAAAPAAPAPAPAAAPAAAPSPADEGLVTISSPMVGTLYTAPDPESPPFVHVGSQIEPNTPVCIIEAMKVFNEIKAEVSGTIERILVHNEQAVEFGQPLMLVRPRK